MIIIQSLGCYCWIFSQAILSFRLAFDARKRSLNKMFSFAKNCEHLAQFFFEKRKMINEHSNSFFEAVLHYSMNHVEAQSEKCKALMQFEFASCRL